VCPTPTGRIHTRVATLTLPILLGLFLSVVTGEPDWIVVIGIYLLMGVSLDTLLYSWLFKYQAPWMTFVLALAEWGLLLVVVGLLNDASDGKLPNLTVLEASVFYWVSWMLAISTKIALLPIFSLTYLESAGEFRRIQWSIPPQQVAMPVLASAAEAAAGPGPVVRAASGVHARPLEPLPTPSGVHRLPVPPPPPAP
jgi:hypothetical protein